MCFSLQRQILLDQSDMEKSFQAEQSLRVTREKLEELGCEGSEEEEESQETGVSEDSDIDLRVSSVTVRVSVLLKIV